MVKETNWDNKTEAMERLREIYPHMKDFLIEICYDIYEQSKTDKDLEAELNRVDVDKIPKPKMSDYDGYEYPYPHPPVNVDQNPAPLWKCKHCGVNENMIDGNKVAKEMFNLEGESEGFGGVSARSETNGDYCEFCFQNLFCEKKISSDIIENE